MAKFGKFWGAIGGSALAIVFYFVSQFAGGTCTGTGADMVCTVFGMNNVMVYGILNTVLASLGAFVAKDSRVPPGA